MRNRNKNKYDDTAKMFPVLHRLGLVQKYPFDNGDFYSVSGMSPKELRRLSAEVLCIADGISKLNKAFSEMWRKPGGEIVEDGE